MKLCSNLTIGADPELFLKNPNSGEFFSAHQYVKGEKNNPWPVECGAIQLDGTAAEFNIYPARDVQTWVLNIRNVMGALTDMTKDSGYVLAADPVAVFDPIYFDQHVPASCKRLGCDPDYNAWTMAPNETPDATRTFRTGAGHVHVGWGNGFDCHDPDHFQLCAEVSRQLDYFLGIHSILWDSEDRRRVLYGRAGAFRPKPYGVEYRTLSNAWLRSEILQRWVFIATVKAVQAFDAGVKYEEYHGDLAQHIINENRVDWRHQDGAPTIKGLALPPGLKQKAA